VTAMLGATEVRHAAVALEQALAQGAGDGAIDALVGQIAQRLDPVMAGLQRLGAARSA
jgi:hypothetical protein